MSDAQFQQTLLEVRSRCDGCKGEREFLDNFEIATAHVKTRSLEEAGEGKKIHAAVRASLSNREIAALILQGDLNLSQCTMKGPARTIAIEGLFRNLVVTLDDGSPEVIEECQVRVVVKDSASGSKLIVISYDKLIGIFLRINTCENRIKYLSRTF